MRTRSIPKKVQPTGCEKKDVKDAHVSGEDGEIDPALPGHRRKLDVEHGEADHGGDDGVIAERQMFERPKIRTDQRSEEEVEAVNGSAFFGSGL